MSTTSKSPRKVLLVAHAAAREALPAYAHRFAPKKYTQPQLLAVLVRKVHQKKDYRGVSIMLAESSSLREAIDLQAAPHWTTLHKACARLLRCAAVRKLLEQTVALTTPAGTSSGAAAAIRRENSRKGGCRTNASASSCS